MLDYCNSRYYKLPHSTLKRLQHVQNRLTRAVIPSTRYSDHITQILRQLHWLPIEKRVAFKIGARADLQNTAL
jgi:hypothetical protein